MKKKPSRIKHNTKNLFLLIFCLIFSFGPLAVLGYLVNRVLSFYTQKFAGMYKKYKIKYDYEQIVPTLDASGDYVFKIDRELKILQLTDLHIGGGFMSLRKDRLAIKAMARMIIEEKPDLVVVTGDIAYPVFVQSGSFGNLHQQKILSKLLNSLGVYWTVVFGNHDAEVYSPYSRYNITQWYKKQVVKNKNSYCIFTDKDEDNASGYGNQFIKVVNKDNVVIQNLILFDSHSYTKTNLIGIKPEYDHIKQDQIDWALRKVEEVKQYNNGVMAKSMMFLHIPLYEYRDAYSEYKTNGESDIVQLVSGKVKKVEEKYNRYNNKTWGINASSDRSDVFNALNDINTLQAVFCGHDHKNDLCMIYKGVMLSYSKPIDYLAYWGLTREKAYRGCNVINVYNDGTFTSEVQDFYADKYQKLEIVLKDTQFKYDKDNL